MVFWGQFDIHALPILSHNYKGMVRKCGQVAFSAECGLCGNLLGKRVGLYGSQKDGRASLALNAEIVKRKRWVTGHEKRLPGNSCFLWTRGPLLHVVPFPDDSSARRIGSLLKDWFTFIAFQHSLVLRGFKSEIKGEASGVGLLLLKRT